MKKLFLSVCLSMLLALLCLGAALAETARVLTPGGSVNMRRNPKANSTVVATAPNRVLVEVVEIEGDWAKIIYKKQTGYVQTKFLLLPDMLAGKTVYADEGAAAVRAEPREDAPILLAVTDAEPVTVLSVAEGWAAALIGETRGYVPVSAFTWQREEAPETPSWVRVPGAAAAEAPLFPTPEMSGGAALTLAAGTPVTVCWTEGEACLVASEAGCGYTAAANICLSGAEDDGARVGALSPTQAAQEAEAALKKAYKAFAKTPLYFTVEAREAAYWCAFLNEADQCLFAALVDADTGKVLYTAAYAGFAAPVRAKDLLPEGEVAVELSAVTLAAGDVLDVTVRAWTEESCRYTLLLDGETVAQSEPGAHFTAAYRPRAAGDYTLRVTVTDEAGREEAAEETFTVDASLPQADPARRVYSQKDGWWQDKKYRGSTMDESGCAVFTLSSALLLMGYSGEEILPESLAAAFALCLTEDGTNNERLIREAGQEFGFGTKADLIYEKKEIVKRLQSGALFSFSVARGHIALVCGVSEDGTMALILDSAPTATFERIVNAALYYRTRSGSFRAALSLDDMPGARWYFETDHYGGLEYWLPMEYVARRGVRLIQAEGRGNEQ